MSRTLSALGRHRLAVLGCAVFTVVALLLTGLVAGTLAGGVGSARSYTAVFRDASGLAAGDDVRISGVRVGLVEDVRLDGRHARVRFTVEDDQPVYAGTIASIDFLNLLGQRYVGLTPGDRGAELPPGATIPLQRTRQGLDLTAIFNAFRPLFDLIEPEDVNELATNIVQVLQGQGPTLRHLTAETARLTQRLVARDEVIGRVIANVTVVMETMDDHKAQFRSLITELDGLTGAIARNREQIGSTLDRVQELVSTFASLLDAGLHDVNRGVSSLAAWAASFERQAPRIAEALRSTQTLVTGYIRSLGLGSYLNTYVCDSHLQVQGGPRVDLSRTDASSRRCR